MRYVLAMLYFWAMVCSASPVVLIGDKKVFTRMPKLLSEALKREGAPFPLIDLSVRGLTIADASLIIGPAISKYQPSVVIIISGYADARHHLSYEILSHAWQNLMRGAQRTPLIVTRPELSSAWSNADRYAFDKALTGGEQILWPEKGDIEALWALLWPKISQLLDHDKKVMINDHQ